MLACKCRREDGAFAMVDDRATVPRGVQEEPSNVILDTTDRTVYV